MRALSDTIARLNSLRDVHEFRGHVPDRLSDLRGFGTNPGALRARVYVPNDLHEGSALVVVLHGCTQSAAAYDHGSGWSKLADRCGFALLFPEQQRSNNPNLCFNWFSPQDSHRDHGEALSIRQMIATVASQHDIDPARIFVTGLSAGGAMTCVMLATYPEVFAGGAIIAGLPYGAATSVPQAFERMRGHDGPDEAGSAQLVRNASGHQGPWPVISVWHGSDDATVAFSNSEAIVGQWRILHGLGAQPTRSEDVNGHLRRVWCDRNGREAIEAYRVAGMGHGVPLDTRQAGGGSSGPYMLEAGISSTRRIARFWNLTEVEPRRSAIEREAVVPRGRPGPSQSPRNPQTSAPEKPRPHWPGASTKVAKVIEDALRSAGLLR